MCEALEIFEQKLHLIEPLHEIQKHFISLYILVLGIVTCMFIVVT